ncbi:hypothetical protein [Longimicrobium sp.]|uniref:hypothetical protein n=1 Tax=Longimicrobium sp. TaxID=2029185 RepID=UPI003B3B3A8A
MNALARGYCRECRVNLVDPAAAPLIPPRATGAPVRICPRCRKGNPENATACMGCGGHFSGPVAWPVEPEIAPDPLPCPGCGIEMETGTAFLNQGTFWQQVFTDRHAWIPLVFRRHESARLEQVLRPGERLQAQRCPACNSVWIAPPPPREAGW